MNEVTLKPIAIVDLCARYARPMGEKKVRHYVLPYSLALVKQYTGQDAKSVIKEYIKRTEPVDEVIFEEQEKPTAFPGAKTQTVSYQGGTLQITDVSKFVLEYDKDILKSMSKATLKSTIHQWLYYSSFSDRVYDFFATKINKYVIPFLNRRRNGFNQNYINQLQYKAVRRLDSVTYIAIGFEANDTEKVLKAFRADLRILQDHKLIIGNLCKPSIMQLADTVGMGKYYTLFAFVAIDHEKLANILGKTQLELGEKPLKALGVQYEVFEGESKWFNDKSPEQLFEIETVDITDVDAENRHEQVLACFKAAIPHVNAVAASMKEDLKNIVKTESHVEDMYRAGNPTGSPRQFVKIDSKVVDKRNGIELDVGEAYNNDTNQSSIKAQIKWEDQD